MEKNFTLENLEGCTYGIIVVDPESQNDKDIEMVHFVGYWEKPDKEDFEDVKRELKEDDQFGLVDIAEKLEYIVCTGEELREIIEQYM